VRRRGRRSPWTKARHRSAAKRSALSASLSQPANWPSQHEAFATSNRSHVAGPGGLSTDPVDQINPGLTDRLGIGAVTAAQAIVSFSHPGRCRSDAAFAPLSGTSPLQASSGKTVRHRLNRGSDRALNSAIHTIAITRIRCCPTTKDYVARRTAEGRSSHEIRRCLKRYIARELYRALNTSTTLTAQTPAAPTAA
jgi:hypothetical protein